MADDDNRPNDRTRNRKSTASDDSDAEETVKLDFGVDLPRSFERPSPDEEFAPSGSNVIDPPRREENPFSFKHFLRSNASNYQNQGARPKVYCDGRPVSSLSDLDLHNSPETKQRIVPEFSSALPDFVQDHLVIEQCYLNKDGSHKNFSDGSNLPDFAPNRSNVNINRLNHEASRSVDRRSHSGSNVPVVPLDLPVRPQADFPLDLPMNDNIQASGSRSCPPSAEVGVSKSLPDFLADGAVRTQTNGDVVSGQSPERDVNRLHQELEVTRRQLLEQTRRADILQRELEGARNKEHEYTHNLAKALGQVEDNLERSNRRATSAENTILKLRQEIKVLTAELNRFKRQNNDPRGAEGAFGGPNFVLPNEIATHRLAQDLRAAAGTAEHSLRQLLTGVDNLRMMASSLENMHRIEESNEPFVDYEDGAGPAL